MFKQSLVGAALLTLLAAGSAQAQITTGTGTPPKINDVGGYALDSTDWLAGQITLNGAQTVTSIQAYLDDIAGGPGDNFNITLYADNGSNKIGAQLDSAVATWNSAGWNGLTGLNWAVAGGKYWVGLEVSDAEQTSFDALTGAPGLLANTASSATGGHSYSYYNTAGTGLSKDLNLGLTVTSVAAVPEPASWLMTLLGLGMVALFASRRRTGKSIALFA